MPCTDLESTKSVKIDTNEDNWLINEIEDAS